MTPEERAETLENIKRAVAESPNSIFGIGQYEFEASDITAAIRETEAAVHAQYQEVLKAAVESSTTAAYLAARANLKGK